MELGLEDLPKKNGISTVLRILSLGYSLHTFVNGEFIGKNAKTLLMIICHIRGSWSIPMYLDLFMPCKVL